MRAGGAEVIGWLAPDSKVLLPDRNGAAARTEFVSESNLAEMPPPKFTDGQQVLLRAVTRQVHWRQLQRVLCAEPPPWRILRTHPKAPWPSSSRSSTSFSVHEHR